MLTLSSYRSLDHFKWKEIFVFMNSITESLLHYVIIYVDTSILNFSFLYLKCFVLWCSFDINV